MAGSRESNASQFGEQTTLVQTSQTKKSHSCKEEAFYRSCRAAYLAVFKSSLENIKSKEQLCLVLQQAGRNPSWKTVNKYWTPQTTMLNFDDFCSILKKEEPVKKTELLKAFAKLNTDNDGCILHSELCKILTTHGEKMTLDEVNLIIDLTEVNKNGKFDYYKFCKLYMTTNEQCLKNALEKLEVDSKLKCQQFGNQIETSFEMATSPVTKPSPKTARHTEPKAMLKTESLQYFQDPSFKRSLAVLLISTFLLMAAALRITVSKGHCKTPLQPSLASSCKICISSPVNMGASSNKNSKLIEANAVKKWLCAQSKGCFFLEDNGEILSHKYKLFLPRKSEVLITIKPVNLSQIEEKCSSWLAVDTALYLFKENETEEDLHFVSVTELRNEETFGWRGELGAGIYLLIPFTTGCRLRKVRKQIKGEPKLVYQDGDGNFVLTKEFREILSQIFEMVDLDGNGSLSLEEYNFFEMRTSGENCDAEAWTICKENFDMRNNELTRQGFMDLNLMEASDRGGDVSDLWVTLLSMGYNRAMELTEACPFSIHIYAEKCNPRIHPVCLEAGGEQLNNAICTNVINKGDAKPIDSNGNIIIHVHKNDARITSVIENKSEGKAMIHLNGEQSKNCVNSRGLRTFAIEVAPNSMMVCQHVMPLNDQEEWIYNCVCSILP